MRESTIGPLSNIHCTITETTKNVASHFLVPVNKTVIAFYVLLISCIFALSVFVSRLVGNIIVLGAYGVFFGAAIATNSGLRSRELPNIRIPFRFHPALLLPVVVCWAVFIIGFVLAPSLRAFLRLSAFTVLSAITLFVVPAVVSREQAFTAISVVGAAFVGVTLPAVLLGDVTLAGIPINWAGVSYSRFGIVFHVPAVIFDTLNYFRVLVALGVVASAGVYARTRKRWLLGVCLLNLVGVYVTLGRAARLATFVAAALASIYLLATRLTTPNSARRALAGVTLVGIFATVVVFAVALGLLPGPTGALQVALGERLGYWSAAYEAVITRPALGWGVVDTDVAIADRFAGEYTGVHNSYLRLFLIGGVIGGITYLALAASALVVALRTLADRAPLALTAYCLVVMTLLFQLFAGGTIFGTSLSSVLWALAIGYAQPGVAAGK